MLVGATIVLALAGCGGSEPGATDTSRAATTTETRTTTTEPTDTTAPPSTPTIVIVVEQGSPRGGIKRPRLAKGQKVVLVIRSDVGEGVHVHGYDIEKPLRPVKPLRIPITATIPGRFEVELHHPDVLLAVLEVQP